MKAVTFLFIFPVMIFIVSSVTAAEGVLDNLESAVIHYAVSVAFPVAILAVIYFQLIHKDEDPIEPEENEPERAGHVQSHWTKKAPQSED